MKPRRYVDNHTSLGDKQRRGNQKTLQRLTVLLHRRLSGVGRQCRAVQCSGLGHLRVRYEDMVEDQEASIR